MRKVNINRDVASRQSIAAASTPSVNPIVEPVVKEETDAQSKELQGSENDQKQVEPLPPTPKRGRKTTGNPEEISV